MGADRRYRREMSSKILLANGLGVSIPKVEKAVNRPCRQWVRKQEGVAWSLWSKRMIYYSHIYGHPIDAAAPKYAQVNIGWGLSGKEVYCLTSGDRNSWCVNLFPNGNWFASESEYVRVVGFIARTGLLFSSTTTAPVLQLCLLL